MKTPYFIILLASTQILAAQVHDTSILSDNHENEIGIANSPVYLLKEKEFAYGLHAHYIRGLKETKIGIGIGYERIFDEHNHNTICVILSYTPLEHLGLNLSPGITFDDYNAKSNFGIHLETLYEFEIGIFHVGPVAEFAYTVEDYHVSLGIHFGFGF